jgi:chloramphenicol 3-O phosphotransferase
MANGQVIFLNGTSSSGKTTIARALQERLAEPYMHVSIDGFFYLYPERVWNPTRQEDIKVTVQLVPIVASGLHRSIAALAEAGNNVIVDHVLEEDEWLKECIERWAEMNILFVGVKCPLQILEQREAGRGDRNIGTARYQYDRVHAHGLYDVEVDTSVLDVNECARTILEALERKHSPGAFSQLRHKLITDDSSSKVKVG